MSGKVVVDANVIISSLINKGITFSALASNALLKKFELIAPEFLVEEIRNHEAELLKYTKLSKKEFDATYAFLIGEISFIPAESFIKFLPQAQELAPHLKDAPYVALALATNAPILSGDKGLKNSHLNVLSPREFLEILLKS